MTDTSDILSRREFVEGFGGRGRGRCAARSGVRRGAGQGGGHERGQVSGAGRDPEDARRKHQAACRSGIALPSIAAENRNYPQGA